jgi:hypothetical protein
MASSADAGVATPSASHSAGVASARSHHAGIRLALYCSPPLRARPRASQPPLYWTLRGQRRQNRAESLCAAPRARRAGRGAGPHRSAAHSPAGLLAYKYVGLQ